jgi:hypothetical protein
LRIVRYRYTPKITVMEYMTGSLCPSYLLFVDILTVVHIGRIAFVTHSQVTFAAFT